MSDFKFEKKLSIEDQKELSVDDQRTYIKGLLKSQGVDDVEVGATDDTYIIPSGGGEEEAPPAGALPVPPARPLAATQPETEDHSDLPPSIRGELGDITEPDPAAIAAETKPEEVKKVSVTDPIEDPEGAPEVAPGEEETFMEVNEQTTYKTREEAIKGFDEKDRTIQLRDEELRLAKQETELHEREMDSLRNRISAESRAEELANETKTIDLPEELPPVPTAQELYDVYDDETKGPLEAMKLMFPHLMSDMQPLIDMAEKLKELNAPEFIGQLQSLKTEEVIQGFQEDYIYSLVDEKFPEFDGKWRDPYDPVGKEYARIYHEIDEGYVDIHGASLTEISKRSPESVQWAIGEVLQRMDAPSENGAKTPGAATTDPPAVPTEPSHTDGPDQGGLERKFSREEAIQLAKETADIAVKAVEGRNKLHGETLTESPGAKTTQPADNKGVWTKEMIRKNPTAWAKAKRSDPNYAKATLDLLPQVRE
jgi:hypothetical protein